MSKNTKLILLSMVLYLITGIVAQAYYGWPLVIVLFCALFANNIERNLK